MFSWQNQIPSLHVTAEGSQELKLMKSNNEMHTPKIKFDQMKQTGDEYSWVKIWRDKINIQ
jgi:hypothetical protein